MKPRNCIIKAKFVGRRIVGQANVGARIPRKYRRKPFCQRWMEKGWGGYEMASHSGEFEAPVDCAEEGEKDSSIADLDGL